MRWRIEQSAQVREQGAPRVSRRGLHSPGHNPNEAEVEGLKTYPSVLDVPHAIDMASVYVPPEIGQGLLAEFEKKQIAEIWLNPGAESDELLAEARKRKLNVIAACSIVGIGRSPYEF